MTPNELTALKNQTAIETAQVAVNVVKSQMDARRFSCLITDDEERGLLLAITQLNHLLENLRAIAHLEEAA